jgi:hypothetical protein
MERQRKLWTKMDVESVFSVLKRTFGEYVYSVKMENMKQELMHKASL